MKFTKFVLFLNSSLKIHKIISFQEPRAICHIYERSVTKILNFHEFIFNPCDLTSAGSTLTCLSNGVWHLQTVGVSLQFTRPIISVFSFSSHFCHFFSKPKSTTQFKRLTFFLLRLMWHLQTIGAIFSLQSEHKHDLSS